MKPARTSVLRTCSALVTATALVLTTTAMAQADVPSQTDRISDLISDQSPEGAATLAPSANGDRLAVSSGEGSVSLPLDPVEDVVAQGSLAGALPITIQLPSDVDAAPAEVASDGTVVYAGEGAVDLAVQAQADSVRILTVLSDSTASSKYTYTFPGYIPEILDDGSVSLTVPGDGMTMQVGLIEAPWAYDATGAPVPTHYEAEGDTLVQVVEHTSTDVTYPVVADPQVGFGLGTYVFFNRAETKTISNEGWAVTGATGVCGLAGSLLTPAVGVVFAAACLTIGGSIVAQAGVAENSSPKKCVRIRWQGGMNINAATYKDSRCK